MEDDITFNTDEMLTAIVIVLSSLSWDLADLEEPVGADWDDAWHACRDAVAKLNKQYSDSIAQESVDKDKVRKLLASIV